MKILLKILGRIIFYTALTLALGLLFILYWSYGENKKVPPNIISNIEDVLESISPDTRVFIAGAEVKFLNFSDGLGITLTDSYIQFGKNIVASVPEVKLKLKLSDLLLAQVKFREISLNKPRFVIAGNMSAQDFSDSASKNFFDGKNNKV